MRQILPFNITAFSKVLSANGLAVEAVLRETLCGGWARGEAAKADSRQRLVAAMGHALFAGGKRFRPFLLKSCAELCARWSNAGETGGDPLLAGAAVECLHTYSLVHDDLPAMDDDDMRRGQPSVHKAFDEATAILAGDALMTLAFEILVQPGVHPDPAVRLEMIGLLSRAAGVSGMAGGQMLDLAAENLVLDFDGIKNLQQLKTGALIAASCEMGAVLAGGDSAERTCLSAYGAKLGLAFQIADDLLDVEAAAADIGKATAKDVGKGKATFVAHLGTDGARALLNETVGDCIDLLAPFGERAELLISAARFAAERDR